MVVVECGKSPRVWSIVGSRAPLASPPPLLRPLAPPHHCIGDLCYSPSKFRNTPRGVDWEQETGPHLFTLPPHHGRQ